MICTLDGKKQETGNLTAISSTTTCPEGSGILELGNVFAQLILRPMRIKNQLHKNPNIAQLQDS